MRSKLGIFNEEEEDKELIDDLLKLMELNKADYTNTFLKLTLKNLEGIEMFNTNAFKKWYEKWQERIQRQNKSLEEIETLMQNSNPTVIPRNHRVEEALEAAVKNDDYSKMNYLLHAITNPFDYKNINFEYTKLPKPTACAYKTYCGT